MAAVPSGLEDPRTSHREHTGQGTYVWPRERSDPQGPCSWRVTHVHTYLFP